MGLTIRQLQRKLSASVKTPNALLARGEDVLPQLAKVCGYVEFSSAAIRNGKVTNMCTCAQCTLLQLPDVDIQSCVDALCRKYGPNADAQEAFDAEFGRRKETPRQGVAGKPGASGNPGDQTAESSGDTGSGDTGSNAGDEESVSDKAAAEEAARKAADRWAADEQRRQALEAVKAQDAVAAAKRRAAALKAAAERLAEAKRVVKTAENAQQASSARRALKNARRATSFDERAMLGAPSLSARRSLTRSYGRLRSVPVSLRNRMAELINRLMGSTGPAGGSPSPIPVYDSRKLVKRMLVKRPLPNALKEDVITGRPVTLFLPDVSPSCEAQAQVACDIANAAGYAGVAGSDVLVFPHSNGCMDEYDDSYIPWFNGRPVDLPRAEWSRLFKQILDGRSRYKIRAVVALGDHDAIEMYQQIAGLQSVKKLVWLHNHGVDGRGATLDLGAAFGFGWSETAAQKTKLVWGCDKQVQMLRGLDLALT